MKTPPFCPNRGCSNYHHPEGKWFVKNGFFSNRKHGRIQRFECLACNTGFSEETFSIDYYTKLKIPYKTIMQNLVTSSGIRDLSRHLNVSCSAVNNRISRLARQSMAVSAKLSENLSLNEDLVADGFESFVKSQYMPNNINILAGKDSQFWFLSDYSQLTRKGRMTEKQKEKNIVIKDQIKINRITIYRSFQNVVRNAAHLQSSSEKKSIRLFTDEHPQYEQVMKLLSQEENQALNHIRISSKKARTVTNPLFSVNYLDREIRKDNSDHVRETVQFAKNSANALDRLAVYRLYHNFIKPFRINGEPDDRVTHGEKAGISGDLIRRELKTLFTQRRFLGKHWMLDISDRLVWCRCISTPMNRYADRLSGFVLA